MLHETKIQLSVLDETNVREIAKHTHMVTVIDNLDRTVKHVLQHQTLPILLCRNINNKLSGLDNTRKDIEENTKNFNPDFLLLDNEFNNQEKDAFMKVLNF